MYVRVCVCVHTITRNNNTHLPFIAFVDVVDAHVFDGCGGLHVRQMVVL